MFRLLQNRVVAVTAGAVVVMGAGAGGAVAANTIGSGDIRDDSVRSIDIRDETLRGIDIRNGSINSPNLRWGSVLKRHIGPDAVGLDELNETAVESLSETFPTVLTVGDLGPFVESNTYCGDGTSTGSQGPVNGTSATPPLGAGSYQLRVGTDGDSLTSLAVDEPATDLADLYLRYSTFVDQPSGSPDQSQAPYVLLDVDHDSDGTRDDQIFFEPVYQNGQFAGDINQGNVSVGEWQTWNATLGGTTWWHFNDQGGTEFTTLADYLTTNPDTEVTRMRISVGCGGTTWAGFVGNIDSLELDDATFDFERY